MAHKINPALLPLARPIADLSLDPKNANTHDQRSLQKIAKSLETFGQQRPVVVAPDGVTVRAGNGVLEAARDILGWDMLAVVPFDSDDAKKLTGFAIADNKVAQYSTWDEAILAESLEEISLDSGFDVGATGFDDDDIMAIVGSMSVELNEDDDDEHLNRQAAQPAPEPAATPAAQAPLPHANEPEIPGANHYSSQAPASDEKPAMSNAAAAPAPEPSHVRMVQLFLNGDTHPPFIEWVKALGKVYGTTTVTDTVLEAVKRAHENLAEE